MKRIELNLAARPLRNRRLFYIVRGVVGFALIISLSLALILFVRFYLKTRGVKARLAEIQATITQAQREERRNTAKVSEASKKDQAKIVVANSIILKKSFSWSGFLTQLEECLPDSSYILALVPQDVGDTQAQFRFKVVSRSLDDLLGLINNLQARNFSQIRVESEQKDDLGQLTSEISVSYERAN
jgi:Tfp pilus assembly protein PilN